MLPNLGGQSGLNLSSELYRTGVLDRFGVKIIGVGPDAIERGEDRLAFKQTMDRLGIGMPESQTVTTVEDAERIAAELGYPVVIRAAHRDFGARSDDPREIQQVHVPTQSDLPSRFHTASARGG